MAAGRLNLSQLRIATTTVADTTLGVLAIPPVFGPVVGKLGFIQRAGFLGVTLNGVLRWQMDVQRFAGAPVLKVAGTVNGGGKIELSGARFPGTQIPADFVCTLQKTGFFGTLANFSFTFGGFHGNVVLERWLAGQQVLQSAVTVGLDVCPLGAGSKLSLNGTAEARFTPAWLFNIIGSALTTIGGLADPLQSDQFVFKLMLPGEPSISIHPKSKRTLMGFGAGTSIWKLKPQVTALPIGQLTSADGLFSIIEIEAGESAAGDTARELLAFSTRTDGLSLRLSGGITDLAGVTAVLPLANPKYSIAFDITPDHSAGDETFLTARFAERARFLVLDGFAMVVGENASSPGFEVDTSNGAVTSFVCEPGLLIVAAPLASPAGENLITKPIPPANIAFLPIVVAAGAQPGWGLNTGTSVAGQPQISLPDFSVGVVRRDDLLSLEFLLFNIALEGGNGVSPRLVQKDPAQQADLVVRFNAPQNLGEQAIFEASDNGKGDTTPNDPLVTPVSVVAAGPSRLAFAFPAGVTSLSYSIDRLLTWVDLNPSLVPVALPDTSARVAVAREPIIGLPTPIPLPHFPAIREPLPTETAIEAPWHLFLSPLPGESWKHSSTPVTLSNRTELWHTRLAGTKPPAQGQAPVIDETLPRKIRAVWHTGFTGGPLPSHTPAPFRMSLDPNDRDQIVRLSSGFSLFYNPPAIDAEKLFLSSLGAWMDVRGSFNPDAVSGDPQFSLVEWRHKAAMARDNYVRVETEGFLLPFGNKAVLVKVTERKFNNNEAGHTAAFLRQRFFIVVKEPVVSYTGLAPSQQRAIPYHSIQITTLVTPNLDPPVVVGGKYSFMVQVNAVNFPFHVVGRDAEQQFAQSSEFSAGMYFVERGGNYGTAITNFNGSGAGTLALAGQKVGFAPSGKASDTTLHTSQIVFSVPTSITGPPFFPHMDSAQVSVPSVQQLTGKGGDIGISYFGDYLMNDAMNAGEVFAKTLASVPVGFNGAQSGGMATPNLQVSGLSRKFGTVSGANPGNIASGSFQPIDYFGDLNAKLFGVVPLKDLIAGVFGNDTVPSLVTNRLPDHIETKLHWAPHVQNYSLGPLSLNFDDVTTALTLDALIATPLTGGAPQASIKGSMVNFALTLAGVIGIKFNSISFSSPAGKKLDVAAEMGKDGLQFLGDLSFLNELRKVIPSDGFQDPPSVEVAADGVTAGFSLAIPAIGVGIFSIENIRLSAALTLPFLPPSPLRFRFAFSEREHPFLITVSLLGGGGFFGITLGPDGVEILEASIEVGANVSIDVVVASGNVHIMVGVYLRIDPSDNASQLTGYLRAGGSLDVLGLISASIEFYLGFTYYFGLPCKIAGEATVTIEVHVLFFSASVSASLRREFADPRISFTDLIGPGDWDYYCDSFAA